MSETKPIDMTALLPCKRLLPFDFEVLRAHLGSLAPGRELTKSIDTAAAKPAPESGFGMFVKFDDVDLAIMGLEIPIPIDALIYGPTPTVFWPTASDDLYWNRAHVRVLVLGTNPTGKSTVELMTALTLMTAAVARTVEAIGVLWCAADHLMNTARFLKIVETPLDNKLILSTIWVRLLFGGDDKSPVVGTHGLAPYSGSELEFGPTDKMDRAAMARLAMMLSQALIDGRIKLAVGDMIETERMKVTASKSSFTGEPVLRLAP